VDNGVGGVRLVVHPDATTWLCGIFGPWKLNWIGPQDFTGHSATRPASSFAGGASAYSVAILF